MCCVLWPLRDGASATQMFVGLLGLYNYHYGELYMSELCDYPIAPTMFIYGEQASICTQP